MERKVPLWVFLLTLLFGIVLTMLFGWAVRGVLIGENRLGAVGEFAVSVASFPSLTQSVVTEVRVDTIDTDEPVRTPRPSVDLSEYVEIQSATDSTVSGLMMRARPDALARAPGYRILVGAFTIDGKLQNAALALSPDLEIVHVWRLFEHKIGDVTPRPPHRKFVHGFALLDDGSVIFAFDGGISLQKFNYCSEAQWILSGRFSHSVTLAENGAYVWALTDTVLVKVDTATGQPVREISIGDIIEANPAIDILAIRTADDDDLGGNSRHTTEYWQSDPLHLNDVDPLPEALASHYPGFEAGDLLVSARSLNLVFVIDPDTLKVKWWRIGATRRQHDPDWSESGDIVVFDNRMGRDYSRIVRIDPKTQAVETVFDGHDADFYSRIRGKRQQAATGNVLITSSQQGRLLEVDPHGELVFEVFNTKPGSENVNYVLSEGFWVPSDALNFAEENSRCAR
jgi:hypothetical protein